MLKRMISYFSLSRWAERMGTEGLQRCFGVPHLVTRSAGELEPHEVGPVYLACLPLYDRFKFRFYPPLITGSRGEYLRVVGNLVMVE